MPRAGLNPAKPPKVRDLPGPLRGLSTRQQEALRPIAVHQGQPRQHPQGYRRRDTLTRLTWKPQNVEDAIYCSAAPSTAARNSSSLPISFQARNVPLYSGWLTAHAATGTRHHAGAPAPCAGSPARAAPGDSALASLVPHQGPLRVQRTACLEGGRRCVQ